MQAQSTEYKIQSKSSGTFYDTTSQAQYAYIVLQIVSWLADDYQQRCVSLIGNDDFHYSMVITLCYDAVSRNVQGLGISPFVMFTLSATTILPACLLLILLQDRIGRKAMASASLLLSGIFISVTGVILMKDHSGEFFFAFAVISCRWYY